jgi:hypothetical protein
MGIGLTWFGSTVQVRRIVLVRADWLGWRCLVRGVCSVGKFANYYIKYCIRSYSVFIINLIVFAFHRIYGIFQLYPLIFLWL